MAEHTQQEPGAQLWARPHQHIFIFPFSLSFPPSSLSAPLLSGDFDNFCSKIHRLKLENSNEVILSAHPVHDDVVHCSRAVHQTPCLLNAGTILE